MSPLGEGATCLACFRFWRVSSSGSAPRRRGAGERVAPRRLDILSEADAPKKALVKELEGVGPAAALTIPLRRVSGKPPPLCGLEVSAPDATKPRR